MGKRILELLTLVAMVALVTIWFSKSDEPETVEPTPQVIEMDLKNPKIGYELTFNRLKPGMTLTEAEAIFGPPDYQREEVSYQQWERPLTQVYYDENGVMTEVGGSGFGRLYLGEKVVFQCGQAEGDIEKTFGPPLSIDDMEYNYPGMMLFCGSATGNKRRVSAVVLGSH